MVPNSTDVLVFIQEREKLIALACSVVDNQSVAEELVQESWVRWQGRGYPVGDARAIFRRIVRNLALDFYRRSRTETKAMAQHLLPLDMVPDSERACIARQELACVVKALQRLPKRTVLAFRMRVIDGLSSTEIGQELCLSRSRAHELVRDALVEIMIALDA